jgi:hypothetical protein
MLSQALLSEANEFLCELCLSLKIFMKIGAGKLSLKIFMKIGAGKIVLLFWT